MRTQKVVADWFADHGWPHAESTGASRQGSDVTGMVDVAVEVKARRDLSPMAWVRQAVAGADGRLPVVVFRPDGMGETTVADWPCLVRLADLTDLLREAGYGQPPTTPDPEREAADRG
ncbi:hypothetical protein MF406_14290 [Georgenia sp. TF02-10]|uniref:hypothetical protein n=1 Tax=Georgenia sp. TF02-10 TaxID=2917725 RepID=UPI001FA794DE|nr:hypothetical protein [Georgenia sp. TF02-10]UNX54101.1 hypothetical protein MF406_14290 [Georgenia sp. TF02-10]